MFGDEPSLPAPIKPNAESPLYANLIHAPQRRASGGTREKHVAVDGAPDEESDQAASRL